MATIVTSALSAQTASAQKPLLGAAALVFAATIWGGFGVLVRILGYNIPFFYGSAVRNLAAGLIMIVPLFWLKQFKPMTGRDLVWTVARSSVGMVGLIGSFASFLYLPMGTAYFMYFGGIILGGFGLGKLLFKEKLTLVKIISLVWALVGMTLVYQVSFNPTTIKYLWLALIAGLAGAFWVVSSKKISASYSALQLNTLDFWIFGILAVMISLFQHEAWSWPTLTLPWMANLLFMIMIIVTGQLIVFGFKHLDAQRGSLILLLEAVLGVVVGAVVFHEQLSSLALVGGALVLIAAALPEVKELMRNSRNLARLQSVTSVWDPIPDQKTVRKKLQSRSKLKTA